MTALPIDIRPSGSKVRDPAIPPSRHWSSLWPPLVAAILLAALVLQGVQATRVLNGGKLTYPIDDAYGHMALAKNLVRHGVWGYSALDGFSSAVSSLLWPLLLAAGFGVFGLHGSLALVFNVLLGAGLLFVASAGIRRYTRSGWVNFGTLATMVLLTPLHVVVSVGMEHTLHALLSVAFALLAARLLAAGNGEAAAAPGRRPFGGSAWLPVVAGLLVMTRYEGLFMVAIVGLLCLCRGWWRLGLVLGAAAAAPVVAYGLYAVAKGWYFLPNSLMLKGNALTDRSLAGVLNYLGTAYRQLILNPHLMMVSLALAAALLAVLLPRGRSFWNGPALLLTITVVTTALHLQLAGVGWFYRYEAYLLILAMMSLGVTLGAALAPHPDDPSNEQGNLVRTGSPGWLRPAGWLPRVGAAALAAGLFLPPLVTRAWEASGKLSPACHNIYEQQYQMGLFLREFYQGKGVVANDICAISYLSDIRLFDIYGLADLEVLRAKRRGDYGQDDVRRLTASRDARVIIIYDTWSAAYGGNPLEWKLVGRWSIPDNIICGDGTVSFYAPDAGAVPELTRALREFAPRLPASVVQDGPYLGGPPPPVAGAYPRELNAGSPYYWVSREVEFNVSPPATGAAVKIPLHPATAGVGLEVLLNGERIEELPDLPVRWSEITVAGPWHEGFNQVRLVGRGQPIRPPGDGRALLFGVRDPAAVTP